MGALGSRPRSLVARAHAACAVLLAAFLVSWYHALPGGTDAPGSNHCGPTALGAGADADAGADAGGSGSGLALAQAATARLVQRPRTRTRTRRRTRGGAVSALPRRAAHT